MPHRVPACVCMDVCMRGSAALGRPPSSPLSEQCHIFLALSPLARPVVTAQTGAPEDGAELPFRLANLWSKRLCPLALPPTAPGSKRR